MYSAYGDESRDETGARVYAVSGVFGHESDWKKLRRPWKKRLGGISFHAADCLSGQGNFKKMRATERRDLYRDLVKLFVESKLIAVAGAIAVDEYYDVFPRDRGLEHAPYLWLFTDITMQMAQFAHVSIPRQRVKVTFDRHPSVQYNASLVYDFIQRSPDQSIIELLSDEVSFATNRTVGIQVADLIARETMNRLDDQLIGKSRVRGSFAALRNTQRFKFQFLRREYFAQREKLMADRPERDMVSIAHYDQWVKDNGLQDCQSNRIHFLSDVRNTLSRQQRIQ